MENTFLSKLKSSITSKGFHASHVLNPHKHWKVLFSVFVFVALLLIAFSFYLLYKIKTEQIFRATPNSNEGGIVIKEQLIKTITESFDQRALKESSIRSNPSTYSDPSI